MSHLDLSQFPFTHTRVFSRIVESLDSLSLLTCRRVCVTWHRWIKKSKVWTQLAPIRISLARKNAEGDTLLNYRLDRMMLRPRETEPQFRALAVKIDRLPGESEPHCILSECTMLLVKKLLESWEQGALENPVIGPVAAHVRVKVQHKVIKKIIRDTLAMYLSCIIVDKKDNEKELIKRNQIQYWSNSWITGDFSGKEKRIPLSTEMERGMRGELTLEEALKESMKSEDEDKKREREEEVDAKEPIEPKSKRSKQDDDSYLADPNEEIEPFLKSHPKFPTLLELLDFDTPIIKEVLIQRCQIDKELIVPQVFIPDLSETSFIAKGLDSDGEVKGIPMDKFKEWGDACINDVEPANKMNRSSTEQVLFWGGRDIRHHWPEFSQQLDAIDEKERQDLIKKETLGKEDPKKKNDEISAGNSSEEACSSKNQAGSSSEDGNKLAGVIKNIGSDSFAHLLARGIHLSVATQK